MNRLVSLKTPQGYVKSKINCLPFFLSLSLSFLVLIVLPGVTMSFLPPGSLRVGASSQNLDSGSTLWQDVDEKLIGNTGQRQIIPDRYRTVHLDRESLHQFLKAVPLEFTDPARMVSAELSLPMPYGGYQRFAVVESPVMEKELAVKFPEIKTFRGQGIDNPMATLRFDVTFAGFHALVLSTEDSIYIDPYAKGDVDNYISYYKRDYKKSDEPFPCLVSEEKVGSSLTIPQNLPISSGQTLRTFRLAVAATGEYTQAAGGTVSNALSAITTVITRVDGLYERELAVRLVLIANENNIIYTNPATDPYTHSNLNIMLMENQANLDSIIGLGNYDIGHVFGTAGGGVAYIRAACVDYDPYVQGPTKGRGASSGGPTGDSFAVGVVAHEIGHQFGALHSFNGTSGVCGFYNGVVSRHADGAYEPGSGSTIMSYGGLCFPQNYVTSKDDYFLVSSLDQMLSYIVTLSCPTSANTMNQPPSVNAGTGRTIPKGTPFTLTVICNDPLHCDPNDDPVTYSWEEYDLGAASPPDTDADNHPRPIFRSYPPTSSPSRTFPALRYIQDSANCPGFDQSTNLIAGEALPLSSRTMNFQVTARDSRSNGGGVSSSNTQVTVTASSGPFFVTAPNAALTWAPGSQQTVTWNVANTNLAPVSCQNVNILLSTDGGNTYLPTSLAANTANDGFEMIIVPNITATAARVRVEAVGNVFFDISDTNFMIVSSACTYTLNKLSRSVIYTQGSYNVTVTTSGTCSWQAKSNVPWITAPSTIFTGTNSFQYTVQGNSSGCSRVGTISVAGQTHTVTQDPTCSATISSLSESYGFGGGSGKVDVFVSDPTTCTWTASSNASWITIISGKGTLGNGTLLYNVAANASTSSRTGTLNVAGYTFTLTQYGTNAGSSTTQATFMRLDNTTQGSWHDVYGADGFNVINDTVNYPSYAQVVASGHSSWTWASSTTELRALQKAVGTDRIMACWYSSDAFNIDLNLTDGLTHQVAIYCMDFDRARTQRIAIVDPATSAVLDSRDVTDFGEGQYLVWNIKGHVVMRVVKTVLDNAVVSGLFFDTTGGSSTSVTYVRTDITTQGNWRSLSLYGTDGFNVINDTVNYPSYAQVVPSGHLSWTWASSTVQQRALQKAVGADRIMACWYSFTNFLVDVNLTDGQTHQIAVYLMDYDYNRQELAEVLDATTNAVLDSRSLSAFGDGVYLVWNVRGHVKLRFTYTGGISGNNAVISGIFFGGGSSGGGTTATYVRTDTTTQGNWRSLGLYGTDGFNVINDTVNYPSYAQVVPSGQLSWTWYSSTSQPRALQKAVGADRIMACWYSSTNFLVDVNLTDGQTHQIAVYLMDYDYNRQELAEVLDATTNAVLDSRSLSAFGDGVYLVWNVRGHVKLRFTYTGGIFGNNAVISGIFFKNAS